MPEETPEQPKPPQEDTSEAPKDKPKPWDTLWYRLHKHDTQVENEKRRQKEIEEGVEINHHPAGEGAVDPEDPDNPVWDRTKE